MRLLIKSDTTGVIKMLTIKNLKPYRVTCDEKFVYVTLAYRYFDVLINNEVYQFIPIEAKDVQLDRYTRRIVNTDVRFAFQKENKIVYVQMVDLMILPQFLHGLNRIVDLYFEQKMTKKQNNKVDNIDLIIYELERENIKRLIDRALDEKNEEEFKKLVNKLYGH